MPKKTNKAKQVPYVEPSKKIENQKKKKVKERKI